MKVELGLWLNYLITSGKIEEVKTSHVYQSEMYFDSLWPLEQCERKFSFYDLVEKYIKKDQTILDVGTANGTTAFVLGRNGYTVKAADFDGNRLRRIQSTGVVNTVPYGFEEAAMWVTAVDVLEHVPNPITAIRWLYNLCTVGAILTFPMGIEWHPPYVEQIVDNHVDWALLRPSVASLFEIVHEKEVDGGKELVLRKETNEK